MFYDLKMELYWRLPVRIQEVLLSLYARKLEAIYYGGAYEETKEWLIDVKNWSKKSVEDWAGERLTSLINLAARRVPYYRGTFGGRDWKNVKSVSDLHLLPILEKQSIRNNEHSLIVDGINPKSLWLQKTSGTTGTSLKIYWPMEMVSQWWAIMEIMVRQPAGVAQNVPRAMIGGRPIVPGRCKKPPYWRYNRAWKQLYLSSYHVSQKTSPDYVRALQTYGSQWMTGYGSAIAALADNALNNGVLRHKLKSIIVSGDTLLPSMRSSIENFFECRCFDHYGQSEGVTMAMECLHGKMHVIPLVGIIEIVHPDGSACQPGEIGEIVATSLLNNAMPLIRYRIGDFAAWAEDQSCFCGNTNPILKTLEGRMDDYLVTTDGRKIGRLSTAMKRSPTIHSAQIVQDKPGHAYLLVRPGEGYRRAHGSIVREDIRERIGSFSLDIIEVAEIPKTPQGKTVLVVRLADRPAMKDIYERLMNISLR